MLERAQMAETFGSYTLLEQIGIGGMAEVFLARHTGVEGFEKEIVIKRIRPHLSAIPSFVNMFLGEAKLAAQLAHPNIVQIYDLGKIADSYFIAMEYVAGRDMSAIIPKAKASNIPFPVEYALKIGSSVCEALYYAHTKTDAHGNPLHIVHRDVSPENIRVAWTGSVKILDFGIAKAATQLHETKAGEIKGKLVYMSPEQVMGKNVDARSDIFSLGIVLYEALTGLKLFSGDNDLAIMNNIIEGKIYPPSYFREDVPQEVEAIIMKALEKDRKKRYQSAFDMQFDIDTFLASHEFTPSNVHLSNFLKQLYKEDIQAEQDRRVKRLPASNTPVAQSPLRRPTPQAAAHGHANGNAAPANGANGHHRAGPPPPPRGSDMYEVNPDLVTVDTSEGVLLTFNDEELARLKKLAERRAVPMESILKDIVGHYLKYVE
jgi:eukaryotic-like serine/threonine-protein kinase